MLIRKINLIRTQSFSFTDSQNRLGPTDTYLWVSKYVRLSGVHGSECQSVRVRTCDLLSFQEASRPGTIDKRGKKFQGPRRVGLGSPERRGTVGDC